MSVKINQRKIWTEIIEWIETILISFCVAAFVLIFLFRIVIVDGASMLPTLQEGEKLISISVFYKVDNGDIIVVNRENDSPIVKRVIAKGGQTIDINFDKGEVYIDGELLEEPYVNELTTRGANQGIEYPLTIPENCYFVMGDNRNNSLDSRSPQIGIVQKDTIFGEVVFRISPLDRIGLV